MSEIEIRELETQFEWADAFFVIEQLRPRVNAEEYFEYLEQMTTTGYRLFGLFVDDELAAVAGVNIGVNMYYGRHLWIDELVTDSKHRSEGYGAQLMAYLEDWASERGCNKVALSSGLQREEAHRFYEEKVGMEKASYVFTKELG
ncbi:GNAT family N-acetyltransferase [Halonotius terrestris]|uniref:GNAT family N-acetyltransferase n=1 Tax=Halonotius terrestris TaxID=2487750 RepID=A0A8J8PCS6_9EURY|nr:GNAT family N-acetyltransferase [Halonotius terrestris]TQQ81179.1 GNAT family N-acetyltransferase [Halonotius terrestris]